MLGFRNVWFNYAALILFIGATFFLNEIIQKDPNHTGLWITIIICLSGITMSIISLIAAGNKKEHSNMATKPELALINEKLQQHISSNNESYASLFDLNKRIDEKLDKNNDKMNELLVKILSEARNESKTEEQRDTQRKRDLKKR